MRAVSSRENLVRLDLFTRVWAVWFVSSAEIALLQTRLCLHETFQPGLSSTRVRFQPAMYTKWMARLHEALRLTQVDFNPPLNRPFTRRDKVTSVRARGRITKAIIKWRDIWIRRPDGLPATSWPPGCAFSFSISCFLYWFGLCSRSRLLTERFLNSSTGPTFWPMATRTFSPESERMLIEIYCSLLESTDKMMMTRAAKEDKATKRLNGQKDLGNRTRHSKPCRLWADCPVRTQLPKATENQQQK